jgi:hypothetical protein
MNPVKTITKELKRTNLIDYGIMTIENYYIPNQFSDSCLCGESLEDFYLLEEPSQVGVQLTAQISHSFYSFLKYKANEILSKKDSFLRIVTTRENKSKNSYDLVLEDIRNGERFLIEIKLSQNTNSWQGSTSTTRKVDLFLLINFTIDRDKILGPKNNGLFKGVFAAFVNLKDKKWEGTAKENNHRTKFDFRINQWDFNTLTENSLIKGGFSPKPKIIHLIQETVNYEVFE